LFSGSIERKPIRRELTTPSVALKLLDDRTDIGPR